MQGYDEGDDDGQEEYGDEDEDGLAIHNDYDGEDDEA